MTITEILGPERLAKGLFWTKAWSLVSGCTPVSPGCAHCWLRDMAHRFPRNYPEGICTPQGQWTGKVVTHPERLEIPLKIRKPQVFAIWSDLFHEKLPTTFINDVFKTIARSPQHIFLAITKRPQNALNLFSGDFAKTILPHFQNFWLITTVVNQKEADIKLAQALQIPAAKRLVLYEPALGPLDLTAWVRPDEIVPDNNPYGYARNYCGFHGVLAGAETGPHARPAKLEWFRAILQQCKNAGIPFFMKQIGKNQQIPDDLMVRELP